MQISQHKNDLFQFKLVKNYIFLSLDGGLAMKFAEGMRRKSSIGGINKLHISLMVNKKNNDN